MAITAVDRQLASVQAVIERHRLDRLIADAQILRRGVIRDSRRRDAAEQEHEDNDLQRQRVRGLWKNLRHESGWRTGLTQTRERPAITRQPRPDDRIVMLQGQTEIAMGAAFIRGSPELKAFLATRHRPPLRPQLQRRNRGNRWRDGAFISLREYLGKYSGGGNEAAQLGKK